MITNDELDAAVDHLLELLPDDVCDAIDELQIEGVADHRAAELVKLVAAGVLEELPPSDFRGLYVGEPLDGEDEDVDEGEGSDKPTGVIYCNLARLRDQDEAIATLMHEVGHALGLSEEEIEDLGLE